MKVYSFLNTLGLQKSYVLKFLAIAFIGIHLPLIGLLIFFLAASSTISYLYISLVVVLGTTLLASGLTLFILRELLEPIRLADQALKKYKSSKEIIALPTIYSDEAGKLLRNIHSTLHEIDSFTEERENFISLITHDIRNHISGMSGMAELIELETNKDSVKKYADLIVQKGGESINFITETLNLIEAENFRINKEDLENIYLKPFINKQIDKAKSSHLDKNVDFKIYIAEEDQIIVHPAFFSQILQNILSNALKFSNENGKIEITGGKNKNKYHLKIKDEGVGFNPKKSQTIFKKFTKERKRGTDNEPTVGLGLYLTKVLIEKHGANIQAKSEGLNKGATFTISI